VRREVKRAIVVVAMGTIAGGALPAGCSSSSEGEGATDGASTATGVGGAAGGVDAAPVEATALCASLAAIACEADATCCDGKALLAAKGGAGGAGGDGGGAPTSVPASEGCEERQQAACAVSLGKLVGDPRTGYDPARGGALVAKLAEAAKGCFESPVPYEAFADALRGTGALGASCTPDDTSLASVRLAAFSCEAGTACHVYLRADGAPEGVCEARTDDACSHPFDCPATSWCDLPSAWKPGVWGTCRPLRAAGWACKGDLECESRVCADDGRCAKSKGRELCLTELYATAIGDDAPVGWWRLGEASGVTARDAAGGHDGERAGSPEAEPQGAIARDADGATRFDGGDDVIRVGDLGLASAAALTVEAWVKPSAEIAGTTLLAFGGEGAPGVALRTNDKLEELTIDLVDGAGASHAATAKGSPFGADAWHHVAATWDGARGALYVDGASVATVEGDFTPSAGGVLRIGAGLEGAGFRGAIDEVAVYDRALAAGRVAAHRRIGAEGPVAARWRVFGWFR
jgi:hypothetical protein